MKHRHRDYDHRLSEGVTAEKDGNAARATEIYRELADVSDKPIAAAAACNLGNLYSRQGEPEQAVEWYQKTMRLNDSEASPIAAVGLANTWFILGDMKNALEAASFAVSSGNVYAQGAAGGLYDYLTSPESPLHDV